MIRSLRFFQLIILTLVVASCLSGGVVTAAEPTAESRTIARCGQGWLEEIDGYPVLHLKGTPYEMGYQHGRLMREHVRENMNYLLNVKGKTELVAWGPVKVRPAHIINTIIEVQKPFVPPAYFEELKGLAAGAEISEHDARVGNFIPEMFHCSGFALMNSATENGRLLHGRVLDYAIDWKLQEHAVVMVCEPDGKLPFVNVSYAGFIGSVTGMNNKGISIGEMGGRGLGHWEGVPMSFLVREALQNGDTFDKAIATFRDSPRTCQYFYVVADGAARKAVGMEASWDRFELVQPGTSHPLLPRPVKDCALLSAGDRYNHLVDRVEAGHGKFSPQSALRLMDQPVAMKSNLHNVLFEPESTNFWVANASVAGRPAAEQPYQSFNLKELLSRRPSGDVAEFKLIASQSNDR